MSSVIAKTAEFKEIRNYIIKALDITSPYQKGDMYVLWSFLAFHRNEPSSH